MIPPLAPSLLSLDSVDVDAAHASSAHAIDSALALCARKESEAEAPGFYLLDDAGGRFVIDREIGVVTLGDDSLLATERGATHLAPLRVIEPSGARYDMDLRLRISGRVPQMASIEESDLLPEIDDAASVEPSVAWSAFAAFAGTRADSLLAAEDAPLGSLISGPNLPALELSQCVFALTEASPAPASAAAIWSH